ncbi:hypothetical protein VTK73DRAFT_1696 [Phialemonium thermophilum]|uniref:Uncharacterized protein n=1 Tax=Phialemonium thermophilum TaxID=223376 RepID=A0ABR3X7X3_9PEZI
MAAMIVGAWLFKNLVAESPTASRPSSAQLPLTILSQDELQDQQQQQYRTCLPCRRVALPSHHLLAAAVLAAGMSLLLAVCLPGEAGRYAAFLVFEVCNGVYMPCVAYQRGLVVNEANRAGMYGLMKLPLFVFVIVALCMTAEGMCLESTTRATGRM